MPLSLAQKRDMFEKGYLKIPGAVSRAQVNEALRAINHNIVTQGIPPEKLPTFHSQSFCPELRSEPVITDLFNESEAFSAAEELLGAGMVPRAASGQMALRFPGYFDPPKVNVPHIDGTYSPHNGVPANTIHHFTMLAAVFLSDVPGLFCGNFAVWPGTHRLFAEFFRANGPDSLIAGMPKIPMPEPDQVTAQAGDVVFAHYTLAHSVAANVSPNIRYAIFFRVHRVDHAKIGTRCMIDIWDEWPGMRGVV